MLGKGSPVRRQTITWSKSHLSSIRSITGNKSHWDCNQYVMLFLQENTFINVCKPSAILFSPWGSKLYRNSRGYQLGNNFTYLVALDIHWCDALFMYRSLARYVKFRVAHAPGMPGMFPPPPRVNDPGTHHGVCVAAIWQEAHGILAS